MNDSTEAFVKAVLTENPAATVKDAKDKFKDMDGSDVGILVDDYESPADWLYAEVDAGLYALADDTPLREVVPS
jgi:hypothetical protein